MDESSEVLDSVILVSQLTEANLVFAKHWRKPEEDWSPKCSTCLNGVCRKETWANDVIVKSIELRSARR